MLETRIHDLQIQPIKGGGPLKLEQARMTRAGLETVDGRIQDHALFVVTRETGDRGFHHFLTQRVQVDPSKNIYARGDPRLALVKPAKNDQLFLSWDGIEEIAVNLSDDLSKVMPVQLFEYWGAALEVPKLSEWLSDHLNMGVRVVSTRGPWNRRAKQNFRTNDNPLRAQDGYGIHVALLEDATAAFEAIGADVDPNRFRYQVLLAEAPAWSLHDYSEGEINGVEVWQPKPCDRCEVTGIDQDKGEFSRVKPLAGLIKAGRGRWIRGDNNKRVQIMGENWLPQGEGTIAIGDTFRYTQRRKPLQFEPVS